MKKTIALVVTLVLVGAFALSATMAYLTGETAPVTNVFVIGDITISLAEEKWNPQNEADFKGKIIPGAIIEKKPIVTVKQKSEKCYLYMCLENTMAVKDKDGKWVYVSPNINGIDNDTTKYWEPVGLPLVNETTGAKKELYRYKEVVDAKEKEKQLPFFSEVTVNGETFTKESMQKLSEKDQTMSVQAFAYQAENVVVATADTAAKDKLLTWKTSP